MKAMLLAAGLGLRMRPLTLTLPKPAIPVLGEALAGHVLGRLAGFGVDEATVNVHHLSDLVENVLGNGDRFGLAGIHYSHEDGEILGTGGGIRHAARFLRDADTIVVHNADFLSDIDLEAALAAHRRSGAAVTLVVAPAREGYTEIVVDADRIVSIGGRPGPADGRSCMFTGCHLLQPEVLDRIPEGKSEIVRDLYYEMVAAREIGCYLHEGWWWEFGTPADFLEGTFRLMALPRERLSRMCVCDPVSRIGNARVAVGDGADFHTGVGLAGRVALGAAARIGEGSHLEDVVVMPEAWVGPGSHLKRVIVAPETELPAGFDAQNVLVATDDDPDGEPPPGCERRGAFLIRPIES